MLDITGEADEKRWVAFQNEMPRKWLLVRRWKVEVISYDKTFAHNGNALEGSKHSYFLKCCALKTKIIDYWVEIHLVWQLRVMSWGLIPCSVYHLNEGDIFNDYFPLFSNAYVWNVWTWWTEHLSWRINYSEGCDKIELWYMRVKRPLQVTLLSPKWIQAMVFYTLQIKGNLFLWTTYSSRFITKTVLQILA